MNVCVLLSLGTKTDGVEKSASQTDTMEDQFRRLIERFIEMSPSFFEIVQLSNGDYALRRVDDDAAPLVKISFSTEAREMMEDRDMSVAKAMIAAGIETVGNVAHDIDWEDDELDISDVQPAYTLH